MSSWFPLQGNVLVGSPHQLDAHGVVGELEAHLHESIRTHFVLDHEPSEHSLCRSGLDPRASAPVPKAKPSPTHSASAFDLFP